MRKGLHIVSSALAGFLAFSGGGRNESAWAATAPAAAPTPSAAAIAATNAPGGFATLEERASYAIGMYFGNQLKRENLELKMDLVQSAMNDVLAGRDAKLTEQQSREAIMTYQQQKMKEMTAKNTKEGETFLAENKKKDGVKVLSVAMPDGTAQELQYKIITPGTGAGPQGNDVVSINLKGSLVNGKEFDDSAKRGKPMQFPLNQAPVKALSEILPRMKTGAKWTIFAPPGLAFGDRRSIVEPGSTVILEVELTAVTPAPAAAVPAMSGQATTSDIIKVPSAAEMKAGAKIETIKAQDLDKMAAQQKSGVQTNKH